MIREIIEGMKKETGFIESASVIVNKFNTEYEYNIKTHEVIDILKKDLSMSYRRIKPISVHANSPKNLVLR